VQQNEVQHIERIDRPDSGDERRLAMPIKRLKRETAGMWFSLRDSGVELELRGGSLRRAVSDGEFARDVAMAGMHIHSSKPVILRSILQSIDRNRAQCDIAVITG